MASSRLGGRLERGGADDGGLLRERALPIGQVGPPDQLPRRGRRFNPWEKFCCRLAAGSTASDLPCKCWLPTTAARAQLNPLEWKLGHRITSAKNGCNARGGNGRRRPEARVIGDLPWRTSMMIRPRTRPRCTITTAAISSAAATRRAPG